MERGDARPRAAHLTRKLRDRLAEAQNWRCCHCGKKMEGFGNALDAPTFDRIISRQHGGTDDIDNIAIACLECNTGRSRNGYRLNVQHWAEVVRSREIV